MQRLLRRGPRRGRDRLLHLPPARPPGRLRTAGAQPVRRGRRGRRDGRGARRGGQGGPGDVDRAGAVRRTSSPTLVRDTAPGDLDGPGHQDRQARRGACARSNGAAALPGEVYPQIACRPIVMQITHERPDAAGRDRRVEGSPRDTARGAGRAVPGRVLARPGPASTLGRLGAPLVQGRGRRRPRCTRDIGAAARPAGRRARHYPVRPDARPGAGRRHGHPVSGGAGQRRRRRDRRRCWPTSARSSGCPTPGRMPASSATPATRPTCSDTGCASARRSRWKRRSGD